MKRSYLAASTAFILLAGLAPNIAQACACGCNVFDIGTSTLQPMGSRITAYVDYDYMDQNQNASGTHDAPAADNADKKIETSFVKLGAQLRVNEDWELTADLPLADRLFRTDDGSGVPGFRHTALGDLRITATYSGVFKDHATGVIFGLKLPTGDFRYANFDRDTEIGSGATDLVIGGYHTGGFDTDETWRYFTQIVADLPVASQGGYRPGSEVDGAAGVSYGDGRLIGGLFRISPVLQVVASQRTKDTGPAANPDGSGYTRILIAPGVQVSLGQWSLYGSVQFPIYQHVNGEQLVAPALFQMKVSRSF